MNDQILSFVRTLLKIGGGFLVSKGLTDSAGSEALIGGALALIGIVWSAVTHKAASAQK